jgi:hypothetical protein
MAGTLLVLPQLLAMATRPVDRILYCAPAIVIGFLMLGYVCAYLECVLNATALGQTRYLVTPGRNLALIVRSGFVWLVCFLAGPVFLAGVGFLFWMHCGTPTGLDWFILAELGVVTVGYWLLCVLAVNRRDKLRDINPQKVAAVFELLGPRTFVAAILASAILLGHGYFAIQGAVEIHRNVGTGGLMLGACAFSGLFWATFLARLLGVWCHLATARMERQSSKEAARV